MDRNRAIKVIEGLYPADSGYPEVANIGMQLLAEARREAEVTWRDEPDEVLFRYVNKCLAANKAIGG